MTSAGVQFLLLLAVFSVTGLSLTSASFLDGDVAALVNKWVADFSGKHECIAEKAAVAVERAMKWDVTIFDGVKLVRNDEPISNSTSRSQLTGVSRLASSVSKFMETHTVALDLGAEDRELVEEGRHDKKKKKHAKGLKYVLMTLLGIFGISGPLFMKTLALISGKALIASKVALLIVGSVALKKIFSSHDHEHHSSVKVHTIPLHHEHEELDRTLNYGPYYNYNNNNNNYNTKTV